jgi:N-acetylglucosaminyldiphosphoundecaprenol N-acetyl-beta-D-mannosaminyltransferase
MMADRDLASATTTAGALVFGLDFSAATEQQLVAVMMQEPATGPQMLVTCNVDHIVNLHRNSAFRAAYQTAWQTTVDGAPVFLYQRLRGGRATARVTGADLFQAVMRALDATRHRPFFITATDAIGEVLQAKLETSGFVFDRKPFLTVPFGFERDEVASQAVLTKIAGFRPTHLFMGIGAPKSEVWVAKHRHQLGSLYILTVGAALEFHAGLKKRAPRLVRRLGLEGVWRLASEPRRLWRRYMLDSWTFFAAVHKDLRCRPSPNGRRR